MFDRRVTVVVGPYGSGKSEIALNGALALARTDGGRVALLDLDLVKPFLRARSARERLRDQGVEVVAPTGDTAFADLPILLPQVRGLLRDPGVRVVADVGGDEAGSRVLGSLADVLPETDSDLLLVLNFRRPFVETVEQAVAMGRGIEAASRRRLTGVVSNTHLKQETTPEVVREGYELAVRAAARLGVPVVAVAADETLAARLDPGEFPVAIFRLKGFLRLPFEGGLSVRTTGPLFVLN